MKEVNLNQGSQDWLNWRKERITATDSAPILGISPWVSAYELYQEKKGLRPPPTINAAMSRGSILEEPARLRAEEKLGMKFRPIVLEHDNGWMGASLDGLSECGRYALEIKHPKKSVHEIARNGIIPDYYYPQVQHIAEVSGIEKLFYMSCGEEDDCYIEVYKDASYIDNLINKESEFFLCLQQSIPPPLCEKDYVTIMDPEWEAKALRYLSLKKQIDALEKEEKKIKEDLIVMSGGLNTMAAGIKLSKIVSKGRIDYEAALKYHGIESCEEFRKPSSESWRITI